MIQPQDHFLAEVFLIFEPDALFLRLPCNFSCSTGLAIGIGRNKSNRSNKPSERQARMNEVNWVAAAPDSSRSKVRFEMPAIPASCAWVRFRSSLVRARRSPISFKTDSSLNAVSSFISRHL